ncbi:nucleoside hydrolase [Paenibacillus thalictri]|uniref:Nucleoside hydrolase n=1 Tax=Paenibacillus thalictri TaxID=2527873 RepID=A0A4V2J3M7_9BACL|nr:nucleoside hydrolase [Paenibacillus thalictri]TBL73934.1 nucleoside hydrolase [Paenibacillus thalictri]
MNNPQIPAPLLLQRLEHPTGTVRMVLDTDTYNEIDDQFAVVQAFLSPERLSVEAIYAAPFLNSRSEGPADGMEKSYDEIGRLLDKMKRYPAGGVLRGSTSFLPDGETPVNSAAAEDLVKRALASPEGDPLYVVAIGAITNIASAILMEPRIVENIVVIWLGGHMPSWHHTREFNLVQDIPAARVVFDSGVPLVLIPCQGVTSHLLTTTSEMEKYVKGRGAIGDFLFERFYAYTNDHFGYSKVIWDMAAIAYLLDPTWVTTHIVHSPVVTEQGTWSVDTSRHFIRCAVQLNRDRIFKDFFAKLDAFAAGN